MRSLCAVLMFAAMAVQPGFTGDDKGIEMAVADFYGALNQLFLGNMKPMDKIWSHADDISYLGPSGGIKIGWEAVRADWKTQAELDLGGIVRPKDIHIVRSGNLAVVVNYEVGEVKGPDGENLKVNIRATSSFRLEDGAWKMIGHHADRLAIQ